MIIVVGSRDAQFPLMGPNKIIYHHEDDPNHTVYNEMCGYRFLMENFDDFIDDPYLGLEHYRRDRQVAEALQGLEELKRQNELYSTAKRTEAIRQLEEHLRINGVLK